MSEELTREIPVDDTSYFLTFLSSDGEKTLPVGSVIEVGVHDRYGET